MTGYTNDGPMKSGINHGDPITGSHAAGVLLAALRYRRHTGEGMFIDVSQQESAVSLIGGPLLAYQMTGQEPDRIGNRSPNIAPHNCYPCHGEDRWVTIAIKSDQEWELLAESMEAEHLSKDPRFSTNASRLANEDDLDTLIKEWTSNKDAYEITWKLQEHGIAAMPVFRGPDLLENPHYIDRSTFVEVNHPQVGPKMYPGMPWKMSETPGLVHWPAPTLGEHNYQIYHELLGLSETEIVRLEKSGIIGSKPTGSRII